MHVDDKIIKGNLYITLTLMLGYYLATGAGSVLINSGTVLIALETVKIDNLRADFFGPYGVVTIFWPDNRYAERISMIEERSTARPENET